MIGRIGAAANLLAIGTTVFGFIRIARGSARPVPTASQASDARRALAGLVKDQWRREAAVRRLYEPDPIAINWRVARQGEPQNRQRGVAAWARAAFRTSASDMSGLACWFHELPRPRLVISGEPGTGKTTLAVLLLLDLIDHLKDDDPVPVLFTLDGWDPDTTDFPSWLTRRITEDYPALRADDYGHAVAAALVSQRQVLPILDGLDEIPAPLRTKVIASLNRAMSYDDQLILTTRSAEYAAAGTQVFAASVITPDPLKSAAIADYIKACLPLDPGEAWRAVLRTIQDNAAAPLTRALATPFCLWLFRQVYIAPGADPRPLADQTRFPSPEAITGHLLASLVDALIGANPPTSGGQRDDHPFQPRHRWNPDDARRWLGYLACHTRTLGTRDLAWWQLPATIPRWQIKLAGAALIGPLLAPLLGPGVWAAFGDAISYARRSGVEIATAGSVLHQLAVGLIIGAPYGLLVGRTGTPPTGLRSRNLFTALARSIGRGLIAGTLIEATAWVVTAITDHNNGAGWAVGIAAGTAAGLATGLTPRPGPSPAYIDISLSGRTRILLKNALRGLATGFAAGAMLWGLVVLIARLMGQPTQARTVEDTYAAILGLTAGAALGMASGLINWAVTPARSARPATPASTLRDERLLTIFRALAYGLTTWLIVGLALVISLRKLGFTDMLEIGLPFGLVAALGAGLASALSGYWPAYVVARILLAARRQLPIRLSTFLDDAYRLGVLRQAGAAYQFRHAILHDHLAAEHQPRPAAKRGHSSGEIAQARAHDGSGRPSVSVER
jgi:hypothetical protein